MINFLAELFREGYQYRSLNSYRSAISAVHARIDGHTVGQHPLVVRMLKGAFNERPPVARYSAFWDVGVVLRYLKSLGNNESLSLRSLTLKTAMLLALARPARSVALSNLDIRFRSFTGEGVIFKAQHLAKQARPSRPLADYFYPRFTQDSSICPVTTLQAYEARTLEFRDMASSKPNTSLFISWIGKHLPVTSSSIARWLKTCLSESGIDTGIFKAHSVRGASSSTAAASGWTYCKLQIGLLRELLRNSTTAQLRTNPLMLRQFCPLLRLQTYMLILRRSLPKCNFRMAQGM